jgi:hypothetical protein
MLIKGPFTLNLTKQGYNCLTELSSLAQNLFLKTPMKYYYTQDGETTLGPLPEEDIKWFITIGKISSNIQICAEGTEAWTKWSAIFQVPDGHIERPMNLTSVPELADEVKFAQWNSVERKSA